MALRSNMSFDAQLRLVTARHRFEPFAAARTRLPRQRRHHFGEDILILLMVLARNALALHAGALWPDRITIFLTCQTLQRRYGDAWWATDPGRGAHDPLGSPTT